MGGRCTFAGRHYTIVDSPALPSRCAATGAVRAHLQIRDLADLDHLDLIAADVLDHLT